MNKKFTTWTCGGMRYLAVPRAGGVAVMNELGKGYGSWMSVKSFRAKQKKTFVQSLGQVTLSIGPPSN